MQNAFAFSTGLIFALGLGISGMTRPSKVLAFLDVGGAWDPSLLFVMVGAIAVYGVAFRQIMRRAKPVAADRFALPAKKSIDRPLVFGAVLFGIGWGLAGFCPGPSLVTLAAGKMDAAIFVAAMGAGMFGRSFFERKSS